MVPTFLRSVSSIGGANILARSLGAGLLIVTARLMNLEGYGELRYVLYLGLILSTVAISGLPTALTRLLARAGDDPVPRSEVLGTVLAGEAGLTLLTLLVVLLLPYRTPLVVVVLMFVTDALYIGYLRGEQEHGALAAYMISASALKFLLVTLLLLLVRDAPVLVVILVIGLSYALGMASIELYRKKSVRPRLPRVSPQMLRKVFAFGWPMVLAALSYLVITSAGAILLERYRGMGDVGTFGAAATLTMVFTLVPIGFTTVLMPRVASHGASEREYAHSLLITAASSLILLLLALLGGRSVIWLLLGDRYHSSFYPFILMSLGWCFFSVYLVMASVWEGRGRPIIPMVVMLASAVVTLVFSYLWIPDTGPTGAAAAQGLGMSTAFILMYLITTLLEKHWQVPDMQWDPGR